MTKETLITASKLAERISDLELFLIALREGSVKQSVIKYNADAENRDLRYDVTIKMIKETIGEQQSVSILEMIGGITDRLIEYSEFELKIAKDHFNSL